jgi:hemerythrin-like domain-containing protein
MDLNGKINRRAALAAGVAALGGGASLAQAAAAKRWDPDDGVTAPEDLMKEHGVLNRCLLIYEEGIRRIQGKGEVSPAVFQHTAQMIRHFVEEYHEKNEEKYIFPVFERSGKWVSLVETLKKQHKAGRQVTANILRLSQSQLFNDAANRERLVSECRSFIRMYRPHESREDTVLFPALRTILSPRQVEALGDRMEGEEKKVLGDEGFERSVAQVATIEKQLGIYSLEQFTPRV